MIQLAKAEGAKCILATAGTDEKTKLCESLGATHGINYKKTDWGEEVKKFAPEGVDLIVDFILGSFLEHQKLIVQARDIWREIYKWLDEMQRLYYLQCSEEPNSRTLMQEQFYTNDLLYTPVADVHANLDSCVDRR